MVQVAPPSQIKQSSNSSSDLVVTYAQRIFGCNTKGRLCWDNDHFVVIPSSPVSRLNNIRNIVGGLLRKYRR
jgi:hypothetical protein